MINYKYLYLIKFFIFVLLSYGMLYFSYKHYDPAIGGGNDFSQYYKIYLHPLDFSQADAPFIYRQFQAVITNTIYNFGFYYPAEISFFSEDIPQELFFSAILSNYIALLLTALIVSMIFDIYAPKNFSLSILSGLLVFLSFGTSSYLLTGLVEGWTWFLVALGFYALVKNNIFLFAMVSFISIFQKETISILFFCLSFIIYLSFYLRNKSIINEFFSYPLVSLMSFIIYFIFRKFVFPVDGYENQLDFYALFYQLITFNLFSPAFFVPAFLSLNLFYLLVMLYAFLFYFYRGKIFDEVFLYFLALMFSVIILSVIGIAAGIGSNLGRILLMLTPIISVIIAYQLYLVDRIMGAKTIT